MGLVKTRRLAAMQKQQKYPPNEVSRVAVAMWGAKAGMKAPLPNSRQPKWVLEPSKLMKMAMAMGECRVV